MSILTSKQTAALRALASHGRPSRELAREDHWVPPVGESIDGRTLRSLAYRGLVHMRHTWECRGYGPQGGNLGGYGPQGGNLGSYVIRQLWVTAEGETMLAGV